MQTSGPEFVTGPEFVQLQKRLPAHRGQTVARIRVRSQMRVPLLHKLREVIFAPFPMINFGICENEGNLRDSGLMQTIENDGLFLGRNFFRFFLFSP